MRNRYLLAGMSVVLLVLVGCATPKRVRVVPLEGGAAAAVEMGAQDTSSFLSDNWGKLLSGLAAAGGLYMVADNNGWFDGGSKDTTGDSAVPSGDGNIVIVNSGGTVTVSVDASSSGSE